MVGPVTGEFWHMADHIRGHVQRLTFHNPENGYTIAQIAPEEGGESVTAVGVMVALSEGEMVEVEGTWVTHPRYGDQLQVVSYCPVVPSNREGIERFLASGLLPGIGPVMAKRLVERFGEATLDIIDRKPRKLRQIPGLGKKRVAAIVSAWAEQRQARDVMVFLQSHGVGAGHAARVFRQYGAEAIQTVRQDPYRLERDVRGIGFPTADQIAAKLGMARDAPERVQAGIRYLLSQAADKGHVYLPTGTLLEAGRELLGVSVELLGPAAEALVGNGGIVSEEERHYLPPLYRAEVAVASLLLDLKSGEGEAEDLPSPGVVDSGGIELGQGQQQAVAMALTNRVLVLTGGPGTGKTTVTRAILRQFEACGLTVHLGSPTGRAAQRLSEATGREARTIHRLLEFLPAEGRFRKDESDQLNLDALIVDEASMIDLHLMRYYNGAQVSILHPAAQRQGGIISRTGYTGEDGFELSVGASVALGIWEAMFDIGQSLGVTPTGIGARDTLRLESGMPLYGHELSEEINPFDAGLGFACHLVGYDFPGRDALKEIERQPRRLKRVGIELTGRRVARQGCPILVEEEPIGRITSGTFSPTLQKPIAMGYVAPGSVGPGTEVRVDIRGRLESARIVKLPFYRRPKKEGN